MISKKIQMHFPVFVILLLMLKIAFKSEQDKQSSIVSSKHDKLE